ncbi:preprotein translocase subunit SecG [bacterium]|jgi:preprotein translocase subunit SecG|nr:preprotein translocase subunit SecG [Verrucomicrobiota bacterium]MBT6399627.1 preprotein translocase subunit SecG [Verrucomicrobiota bacterium]MDB4683446.1 preprotein translocase subunit SecG [bacterium]MDC0568399.1 preprotein translocase subunit SecG [Akkermansiaceae bacterium]
MLDIFITLVVIAHVVVSLLLILVILMQRPKQEGLGAAFGAGMTDAAFGAKTTDVLQKGTVYLGTLFFIFSLVLAILMGKRNAIEGKNYASDGGSSASAPVETTEAENSVLGNAGNVVAPVPAESIAPPAEAIAPPAEAIAPPAETNEAPENPDESPTDGANTPTEENKVPVGG